jgi:hypothetical protein
VRFLRDGHPIFEYYQGVFILKISVGVYLGFISYLHVKFFEAFFRNTLDGTGDCLLSQ